MSSLAYQRCGFATDLPTALRYTRTHFWLAAAPGPALWRVGFTAFAARVLGELVELEFAVQPGSEVQVDQKIGSYEGFKGVTDLYCVLSGRFRRANPELELNGDWIKTEPYTRGWLYELESSQTSATPMLSAAEYARALDAAIDSLQ